MAGTTVDAGANTRPAPQQDAVALLKADHRKVEDLFEAFEKAKGADKKAGLVKQICTELKIHTVIEEDLLDEAYVEHDAAKKLIAELEASAPDEEFYDAKVKVLSEEIEHHVEEEEKRAEGMFAQAKKAGLDMDALGDEMAARKASLMADAKAGVEPPSEPTTFKE